MKGIILAGGTGSRLFPLTYSLSKYLLPIYDKPMIYYPLSTLMLARIREVVIISTTRDLSLYKSIFQDGRHLGMSFSYLSQEQCYGDLDQSIGKFIDNESVCLITGDNIFHGNGFASVLCEAIEHVETKGGAMLFGYHVQDCKHSKILEFDESGEVKSIEKNPSEPKSNYAMTGLYLYDNYACEFAKSIIHSPLENFEITDLNQYYLLQRKLKVKILHRGFAWLDTGTHRGLLEAARYVSLLEERQGLKVACIEEIAWRNGFISTEQLKILAQRNLSSGYGKYLLNLL